MSEPPRRLALPADDRLVLVALADISHVDADGNHVVLHAADDVFRLRATLADIAQRLGPGFVRIHRSHVVNVAHVREIVGIGSGDCEVALATGARLPASRTYAAKLRRGLGI